MEPSTNKYGLEPVLVLLFAGMIIYTLIVLGVAIFMPKDGQTFQLLTGVLGAFVGAFFGRINPQQNQKAAATDPQNPLGLNKPGPVA